MITLTYHVQARPPKFGEVWWHLSYSHLVAVCMHRWRHRMHEVSPKLHLPYNTLLLIHQPSFFTWKCSNYYVEHGSIQSHTMLSIQFQNHTYGIQNISRSQCWYIHSIDKQLVSKEAMEHPFQIIDLYCKAKFLPLMLELIRSKAITCEQENWRTLFGNWIVKHASPTCYLLATTHN